MAEMLLIGAAAVLTFVVVLVVALVWRPPKGDDGDRFSNARRITTGWAADAGTDLAHPAPGQPGTVDTTVSADASGPSGGDPSVRVVQEIQTVTEPVPVEAAVPEPRVAEPQAPAVPKAPETPRRAGGRATRA